MNGVRQILKYVDTKLLMIAGALFVAILVVNFVVLSGARARVEEANATLKSAQQEVSTLEAQVADIRENGTGDLQQLVSQIAALEMSTPKDPTPLFATTTAARIASESGVELVNFSEAEMGASGKNGVPSREITVGVLSAKAFTYTVNGSYADAIEFFNNVLAETTWVATVESATLQAVEVPGLSADEQDVSLTGSSVSMSGVILVWGLNVSPVIPPVTEGQVDPNAPVDPNSPAGPNAPAGPNGPLPVPVDPNAPVNPNTPVDPNAPVDPNTPVDPNAPADPNGPLPVPVDPNAPAAP